jgi:hypothetical protein
LPGALIIEIRRQKPAREQGRISLFLKYFFIFWKRKANKPFYKQRKKKVVKRSGKQIGLSKVYPKSVHNLFSMNPEPCFARTRLFIF